VIIRSGTEGNLTMTPREEILGRMKTAEKGKAPFRPSMPPLTELALDGEQMIQRFTLELSNQTGVVHRTSGKDEVLSLLTEIASREGLKTVITAGDDVIHSLDLGAWGAAVGVKVIATKNIKDRETLREEAFTADAGITSADFAIAETGTIGMIFNEHQPRLTSIAPPIHIAIIPVERLYPIYESAIERVFKNVDDAPSQFCFITGPSSTADIQAVQFKGMHGPTKMIVIFIMGQA